MNKLLKASIAGLIATGFVSSGLVTTAANAAPGDQAVVTVSKSTGLNPDGETITITGSGFVANGSLTNGTRPPLAGTFSGFYVSFGKFQDVWRPSASAPSGNRKSAQSDVTRTNWLVPAASLATIGGAAGGGVGLAPDGTFTITLNVSKTLVNNSNTVIFDENTIGNYGIYTYGASGANYAPFETYTPLTFSQPAVIAPAVAAPAKLGTKVANKVQFASGDVILNKAIKRELASKVSDYKIASKVTITSAVGATPGASKETLKAVAKRRAVAIKKYLVSKEVPAEKIVIKTKIVSEGSIPQTRIVAIP